MNDVTQKKKKLKTIYLVSQFIEPKTIKDLDVEKMNQIFGRNLMFELRYLLNLGLIQQDKSLVIQLKRIVNSTLYDIPLKSTYIKTTAKGQSLVRGFERKIESDRQRSHTELDVYLLQGELTAAVEVLRAFYYGNTPLMPPIWGEDAQPKTMTIQAARNILENKVDIADLIDANDMELTVLRLQAAELCLSNTILIDRISQLNRELHKNGNHWLVTQLRARAHQQALMSQSYQGNIADTNTGSDSYAIQSSIEAHVDAPLRRDADGRMLLPKVKTSIRFKITIPYIILASIITIIGAFILTQALLDSIEQRFFNQLIETGKLASDRMVIEENRLLETMRLIANTEGVPQSITIGDAEGLRELVLPLATNSRQLAVEILDSNGVSILSMRRDADDPIEDYEYSRGETSFADWEIVQPVMGRVIDDNNRDKYAGFVQANWGDYFYISGPIIDDTKNLVGVVLIGKPVDDLVKEFREDTLAQVTLYDEGGNLLASSLLNDEIYKLPINSSEVSSIFDSQDDQSIMRNVQIASISYRELLGPWEARNGNDLGVMGTALPESFLVNPSQNTRIQIFALLFMGVMIIIAIGVYIARRITRPLHRVVDATQQVAKGDLNVSVQPEGHDEIALLAHAFNHMVQGLQEVTERRFREIELVQQIEKERDLRQLKSRFVSMVSHEFRTPLATILSSSDYIRKYGHKASKDKKTKHFDRIQTSVKNMTELLEDVLLIGRTEAGRLEFNPEKKEFISFCQSISDEMQMNSSLAHEIVFNTTVESLEMMFDPRLMRLVLTNLLSNAVKYSPEGGEVGFDIVRDEAQLTIHVKDSGIGIPPQDQERLFTPFSRAGNVGSIGGTGLGLYIAKMVVELHEGNIEVESIGGQGTTFVIQLPIIKQVRKLEIL